MQDQTLGLGQALRNSLPITIKQTTMMMLLQGELDTKKDPSTMIQVTGETKTTLTLVSQQQETTKLR